jgi:hypothetical protein
MRRAIDQGLQIGHRIAIFATPEGSSRRLGSYRRGCAE